MVQITTDKNAYLRLFKRGGFSKVSDRHREALKQALDIRKFEIDTYWKRATYFWALIAASFIAFFALRAGDNDVATFLIGCLGMLFAVGWYLVNRGSSSWQRNWEAHVDLLEDAVMGPLYKTHMNRKLQKLTDLAGPFPYSPSRINTMLSLITLVAWALLLADLLCHLVAAKANYPQVGAILVLALFGIFALVHWGKSTIRDEDTRDFEARTRTYHADTSGSQAKSPAK